LPARLRFILGACIALAQSLSCIADRPPSGTLAREDSEAHVFALCQDGRDNDGDGRVDCDDPDCDVFLVCNGGPRPDADGVDAASGADASDATATVVPCDVDEDCDPAHGVLCRDARCQVPADYTVPPAPTEYAAMGMVRPAGLAAPGAPVGTVIGTFCGVDAHEHGPNADRFEAELTYGFTFQSVELAYRYLCRFAADVSALAGERGTVFPFACRVDAVTGAVAPRLRADRWYDAIDDPTLWNLERHPSGGTEPPRPGDVIAFDVAPAGHLAIVTRVTLNDHFGLVEVLEQGLWESSHRYRLDVSAGHYSVPGARGWLRVPVIPPACAVSGRISLSEVVAGPDGRDLLVIEADATATRPTRIARLELVDERGMVRLTRDYFDPLTITLTVSLDLEASGIASGEHTLTLAVTLSDLAHPAVVPVATTRYRYVPGAGPHPYRALFAAAAVAHGVPVCLLEAVAEVASGWWQGARSPVGAVGVMGIGPGDLSAAAALGGVDAALLATDSDDGAAANIDAAAALLASWAHGGPGADGRLSPGDPAAAVESWWPAVARLGGAGLDGDYATSAFAYRVYDRLARGVPGRVLKVAGLDVAALAPLVSARPATPEELAVGDVLPGDAALDPPVAPFYLRRAAPVPAASLTPPHTCAGACATSACEATHCAPAAEVACVGGALMVRDSCGAVGDLVDPCEGGAEACAWTTCAAGRCVAFSAPDATPCGDDRACSAGQCSVPNDADGDGYYSDREPLDCVGHDDDEDIHPGHPELLDVRDNDCDGLSDVVGYTRLDRYFKVWGPEDWEHRYAATPIDLPGWVREDRWIGIYPLDICDNPNGPPASDDCTYIKNGSEVSLQGAGFVLIGLMQCTGVYADSGKHITLLLKEDSGEYGDYHQSPYFTCRRLGYLPGTATTALMPSLRALYRHRASFISGVSDNMWSVEPAEGEPQYDTHGLSLHVLDGG
jgi:hypothetical protein